MTDKEIIIDRVNVGQCKYLNTFTDCDGYHYYCDLADDIKNEYCEHYKDCYFKHLQRKEQECDILRKEYQQLQERFSIIYDDLMYINVYQCKKCGHYTMKDYVCHICGTDPTEAKDGE